MAIIKAILNQFGDSATVIYDNGDQRAIPFDNNSGYQDEFMKWKAEGNTPEPYVEPEPSWIEKRLANMADGGYGTTGEQFEMIGEQGMEVYQAHIAKVKTDIPKE